MPFSLTSPSSLLKLLIDGTKPPWPWTGIRGWHPVWPEKTAEISRRHTGLPRNDGWETSADIPYWWRVTTQIWIVSRHQYGISALVSQTSFRGEISGDVAKCQLFSQATSGFNLYSTRIQVWLCAGVKIWAQLKFEMLCPCASVAVLCYKFFLWLLNQILWDTITLACFNTSVEEMCTSIISFPM